MASVTCLQDVLRARDMIRKEQATDRLRGCPIELEEREARIRYYRLKAKELGTIAEDVILYETKQTLLSLACSYEFMADALTGTQNDP